MLRINRLFALLLVALLLGACQSFVTPMPMLSESELTVPRFEPAECPDPSLTGEDIACGYLIVPEDRSQPDGPTIRLPIVNFKSKSATPAADPIVLVPGGPGATRGLYIYLWTAAPVADVMRAERDVLMIEHRGANYAEPAFYCPEMEADLTDLASMSLAEEIAWSSAAYQACGERLAQEGHNLSLYGSLDAAADIADLRIALGYEEINVYGVSYGTLPALHLMRDYPAGIRSVILDSIWPTEINQTVGMLEVVQGVQQAVFRACAEDPVCNENYPDLEQVFYDLLAQLRANPVSVTVDHASGQSYTVTIDDLKFLQFFNDSGFAGEDFTQLPAVIYTAQAGDFTPAAQGWLDYLSGRHGPTGPGSDAWSMGLYNTVMCLQDGSTSDTQQAQDIYAARGGNPSVLAWAELAFIEEWLGPCATWPVTPPEPNRAIEPVVSDIPTLMWVNTFDIFYAPSWSRPVAERLTHGYLFEFPLSHGSVLGACPLETLQQFLADPTQAPDASCIQDMQMNWVLPTPPQAEPARTTPAAQTLDEETIARIEAMIEETIAAGQVPGAAVGVVKDGQLVYSKGFGVGALGSDEPVTPETVFLLASVSKSVVAVAVMQLVEEGKIDLDAPVTEYLPYFTLTDADMEAVTIRRLLSHVAGMPDTIDWMAEYQNANKRMDDAALEDYVRSLSNESLIFAPGTGWSYSNIGFVVLGDVIAKVSGQSFEQYVHEHVLQPLGMDNSSYLLSDIDTALLATPHIYGDDGKARALDFFPHSRTYAPAGSFYSSVNEMARFAIANLHSGELEGTRVLSASAYTEMWAPQAVTTWGEAFGPQVANSGLGWFVGEYEGHRLIGNYGVEIGFQSHLALFPDEGYAVIALVNFYDPTTGMLYAYEIGNSMVTLLLGSPPQATLEAEPFVALSEVEFTSDALADNLLGDPAVRKFVIYLPPSYASGEHRYPVVYVLHGFTGNQWSMMAFQETMDAMIQNGDIPEMIVVMPDASNTYLGSFYMNSPTIGDYESYITGDLVAWVDAHYRTLSVPEARGITGCSMGGLGAVRLGLQHPQVYGVVAGVSGPYVQAYHRMLERALAKIESIPQTMAEMSAQPFEVQAIFALAAAAAPNPDMPPFYLEVPFAEVNSEIQPVAEVIERFAPVYAQATVTDYSITDTPSQAILLYHGDQDPMADVEGARLISAMLTEKGVAHEYMEQVGGGHCNLAYDPVIQFMAEHLLFEPTE